MVELINKLKRYRAELSKIQESYYNSYVEYYRYVIRTEDIGVLRKISKIPDNWTGYVSSVDTVLTDSVKKRLSDIKEKKSWEVKIQSLYLASVITIEKSFLAYLKYEEMDENDIEDANNSISNILLEIDDKHEYENIKFLILSLAKRSISDSYYLMRAYIKYTCKKSGIDSGDVKSFLTNLYEYFKSYPLSLKKIREFLDYELTISHLFDKSSNRLGWRLDEVQAKSFFDKNNSSIIVTKLSKIVKEAYKFKNELKERYLFLKYYYSDTEGKEFRLNFIKESLQNKVVENKISESVLIKFNNIYDEFKRYKAQFNTLGLYGFGPEEFMYIDVLQFVYKSCKVIEFYYLRSMQYENLKSFRNEIQLYVENEIFSLL